MFKDKDVVLYLDELTKYLYSLSYDNPNFSPLSKIFTAYGFSYAYHNPESTYYHDNNLLNKSYELIVQGKSWNLIVQKIPQRTHDFSAWAMYNYMKITPELSDKHKSMIRDYIISVADEVVANKPESVMLLDIPNHAILKILLCNYAYALTFDKKYQYKASKIKNYVLNYFDDGVDPEISVNYSPLVVVFLTELYRETGDKSLFKYIKNTAEIIPTFLYKKTGDVIAVDHREVLKMVSCLPYGSIYAGMRAACYVFNDGKYLSIAKNALDYLRKNTLEGACNAFPLWKCHREITDTAGLIERFGTKENITAWNSFIISLSTNNYNSLKIEVEPFPIKYKIKKTNLLVIKKQIGDSEAIISNIYQSPVAYMTPDACLVGWVASKGMYYPSGSLFRQYNKVSDNIAELYFPVTKSHSTAFFHKDNVLWIHTIKKNRLDDVYWLGYLYTSNSKIICGTKDKIIESKISVQRYPLDWVLLHSKGDNYLGIAIFGTAKLKTYKDLFIVYKKNGIPVENTYSVLVIREWNENPEKWQNWLNQWSITGGYGNYTIKTPDSINYNIIHKNHYLLKRLSRNIYSSIARWKL